MHKSILMTLEEILTSKNNKLIHCILEIKVTRVCFIFRGSRGIIDN